MFLLPFVTFYGLIFLVGLSLFLLVEGYLIYKYWLKALLVRKVPKRTPAPSHKKSKAFIRDIIKRHETLPKESAEWLTVFLAKWYSDFFESKAFDLWFYTQYVRNTFNLRRTILGYIIKRADLGKFYSGDNFLRIKNVCVPYYSTDHTSVTLTMDASYDGNMQGTAYVETIFGINFAMKGTMSTLSGTLMLQYDREYYSYSFLKMPRLDMVLTVFINGYEFPLMNHFAYWVVMQMYKSKNVLPNTRTRWHKNKPVMPPYPWEVSHQPELLFTWPPPPGAKYDPDDTDCE